MTNVEPPPLSAVALHWGTTDVELWARTEDHYQDTADRWIGSRLDYAQTWAELEARADRYETSVTRLRSDLPEPAAGTLSAEQTRDAIFDAVRDVQQHLLPEKRLGPEGVLFVAGFIVARLGRLRCDAAPPAPITPPTLTPEP